MNILTLAYAGALLVALLSCWWVGSVDGRESKYAAVKRRRRQPPAPQPQQNREVLTEQQVIMFDRLDENKDGEIDILEFTASWHDAPYELWEQDDSNNDGRISKREFGERNQPNSPERPADIFELLDDNGDGCISKSEFESDWHGPPKGLFETEDDNGDGCIRRLEFGN